MPLLMLLDAAALVAVIAVLAALRYEVALSTVNRTGLAVSMAVAFWVYVATYAVVLARRVRWGTTEELAGLGIVTVVVTAVLVGCSVLTRPALLPLSVAVAAGPCAFTIWLFLRFAGTRLHRARMSRTMAQRRRAVIVGAGHGGRMAVRLMREDMRSGLNPVALVDDDPAKKRLTLLGVRVRGQVRDLEAVVEQSDADVIVLAAPTAPAALVAFVMEAAAARDCELLVLPSIDELLGSGTASAPTALAAPGAPGTPGAPGAFGQVELGRQAFRPVSLEDLLGRGVIDIDTARIGEYLRDKIVLVTGAGGSIGSQLCREIARFEPRRLVLTDRDDSLLHDVQLSLDGRGLLDSDDLVLGDLRRPGFIDELVTAVRPEVVFHAAAIKHLTLAERHPVEAFLTNVCATADLLGACVRHEVAVFVNISTDKAADPTSVLGYTKRVTERLTSRMGTQLPGSRYLSVRFGNVLGSRGSALMTFANQLASGRPLTVTDPGMHRYFMTTHEACQLVLQAAADGETGDGLVLDMGDPHNIEQVARRFAALQGHPEPRIVYTGAREAEKLSERTLAADEVDERPFHPLISRVRVPVLDAARWREMSWLRQRSERGLEPSALREWLSHAATGAGASGRPASSSSARGTPVPPAAAEGGADPVRLV